MKRMIKRKWWRQEWRVAWSWESYSLQSILKILPFSLVSALRLSDSLSLTCSHLLNSSSKAASFLRLDRLSHSFSESVSPPPASLILSQFLWIGFSASLTVSGSAGTNIWALRLVIRLGPGGWFCLSVLGLHVFYLFIKPAFFFFFFGL